MDVRESFVDNGAIYGLGLDNINWRKALERLSSLQKEDFAIFLAPTEPFNLATEHQAYQGQWNLKKFQDIGDYYYQMAENFKIHTEPGYKEKIDRIKAQVGILLQQEFKLDALPEVLEPTAHTLALRVAAKDEYATALPSEVNTLQSLLEFVLLGTDWSESQKKSMATLDYHDISHRLAWARNKREKVVGEVVESIGEKLISAAQASSIKTNYREDTRVANRPLSSYAIDWFRGARGQRTSSVTASVTPSR